MINYIEKGIGLHKNLTSLGLAIADSGGVWVNREGRDEEVNAAITAYPLSSCVSEINLEIDAYAAALRDKVTKGISPAEMSSWSIKRSEAIAFTASGNATDAPTLSIEAKARGVTVSAIVERVTAGAIALAALEANIAGNAGKHKDAVRATTTFADALAYDWSGGWPSV